MQEKGAHREELSGGRQQWEGEPPRHSKVDNLLAVGDRGRLKEVEGVNASLRLPSSHDE